VAPTTVPSSSTTIASDTPARARRLMRADSIVGLSPLATAARKPKSRASTSAAPASDCWRSVHSRSYTAPLADSSASTDWRATWLMITCASSAMASSAPANSPA
jgi:hypothetical protein